MNLRAQVVERLCNYEIMCVAVKNLQEQIQWLKLHQEGLHAVRTDRVVVQCQSDRAEERLLEDIEQRRKLEIALENTRRWLQITDRALQTLSKEEQLILRKLYICKTAGAISALCQRLQLEKSSIYRKRDRALDKLVLALYGVDSGKQ